MKPEISLPVSVSLDGWTIDVNRYLQLNDRIDFYKASDSEVLTKELWWHSG